MDTLSLAKKLEGAQTITTVMDILKTNRQEAIYYIHRLRKLGYVKTRRLNNKRRVYNISAYNRLGGISYYDMINDISPVKLVSPVTHFFYGKRPSFEEALVFAVKSGSLRLILASLAVFRKIGDWGLLYRLAKENNLSREVAALYDLSRHIMRTRSANRRFLNNCLPKKTERFQYIIKGLRSKDFKDIEKKWKVYLPFNKADLEDYR